MLARSRQSGTLSLALRSMVDANRNEKSSDDDADTKRGSINIVRYGVSTPTSVQK